jgi:hypothetical protein
MLSLGDLQVFVHESRLGGRRSNLLPAVLCLSHVLSHVPGQDLVNESLISDTAAARFFAELLEHSRIDANRDQSARFAAERRPPHSAHGLQLLGRRVRDVREVNLSAYTPRVRGGSPAAR